MSFLSKLFGRKPSAPQVEVYENFAITPQPQKEANGWRIGALIEKDGLVHELIRADMLQSQDQAMAASVEKAKQVIDEQGMRLFG